MKWSHYWAEVVFGVCMFFFREYSLLLFFVYVVISSSQHYDRLRKLIRIYQIGNEDKLLAILNKMEITPDDLLRIRLKEYEKLNQKQKDQLDKDFEGSV